MKKNQIVQKCQVKLHGISDDRTLVIAENHVSFINDKYTNVYINFISILIISKLS